ncbi:YolD-like family protein [Micrococcus luteus]|nr:YolD-like family protein [Micrococcus luteus]
MTPGSNLLWSTKFILPEHREAMQRQDKNNRKQVQPVLDEQEQVGIDRLVRLSFDTKTAVTLRVFGEFEDRKLSGVVVRIDRHLNQIQLAGGDGEEEWIRLSLILGAEERDAAELF